MFIYLITALLFTLYKNRMCVIWNIANSKITGIFVCLREQLYNQFHLKNQSRLFFIVYAFIKPMLFCYFDAVEILRQTAF